MKMFRTFIIQINKSSKISLFISFAVAILFMNIFYPGFMSPDSYTIYAQAKAGSYGDHHPPMMAYLWRFFLVFYDGSALMYLTSMSMLWGSCIILALAVFKNKSWRFVCLLIPFVPQVASFAGFIIKDNFFTFGYLLLSMWLSYKNIRKKKFNWLENIGFFTILLYATSTKYQAQFILPILLFWYASIQFADLKFLKAKLKPIIKNVFITVILCFSVIKTIDITNNFLITKHGSGSNNAWQYKKIYDLVGASINTQKILLPKYLSKKENLTLKDLKDHYEMEMAWEPLIVYDHSPLRATKTSEELTKLNQAWKKMIFDYPTAYLKHRLHIWTKGLLLSVPGEGHLKKKFIFHPLMENQKFARLFQVFAFLMNKFPWLLYVFSYSFIFPVQIYFLIHSFIVYLKLDNKYAKTVFFMSLMGLSLLFLLLFFSLAAVARYIYFTNVMFFFSIPFFFAMYRKGQRKDHGLAQ